MTLAKIERFECFKEDRTARTEEARDELKKSQIRYKWSFDKRMNCGNADIKAKNYLWLYVQDGRAKEKLGGHAKGPCMLIDRLKGTSGIPRGGVV